MLVGSHGFLCSPKQEQRVDHVMDIGQREAEETMRALARVEGIFAGAQIWQCPPACICSEKWEVNALHALRNTNCGLVILVCHWISQRACYKRLAPPTASNVYSVDVWYQG